MIRSRLRDGQPKTLNRQVWSLAIPIMVMNVSLPLLHVVDTAVVGRLPGAYHLGAVAVGTLIFNVIVFGLSFVRMGTAGLAAQALGAGDADEVRATLGRAIIISLAVGGALVVLQVPFGWGAFALIGASPEVQPLAETYYAIRIWGIPASLANFALSGWFVGVQNTRAALWLQVVLNGLNIVLDVTFVLGFGWGVPGVAIATILSEFIAIIFGAWLVLRNLKTIGGTWQRDLLFNRYRLKRTLAVNRDIFIRNFMIQAVTVAMVSLGARAGDTVLAANAILFHFHTIGSFLIDGFSNAASAMVGHAVGARDRLRVRAAVRATGTWAVIFGLVITLIYALSAPWIIDAITTVPEVRETARIYVLWAIVTPIIGAWAFEMDGVFFGATRTRAMRNAMFFSVLVFFAVVALLYEPLGNHALWLGWNALSVARALTLSLLYPALLRNVPEPAPT